MNKPLRNAPGRDALELMDEWFPPTAEEVDQREQGYTDLVVGALIYEARTAAELTQAELAQLLGTKPSTVSRLEDAEYEGHSMAMLRKVAEALGKRVVITFADPNEPYPPVLAPAPKQQPRRARVQRSRSKAAI